MASRQDVDSLMKVQSDVFNCNIQSVISIFESRLCKFETELREARSEICDLRRTNVDQIAEINQLRGLVEKLRGPFVTSEASQKTICARVDYLEDRSRRYNLKFEGLSEDLRENWEQSAEKVRKLIKEKLGVYGEVESAHRVGKFMSDKPRPVIAKFLRFTDKQNILRNSKKLKGHQRVY